LWSKLMINSFCQSIREWISKICGMTNFAVFLWILPSVEAYWTK
jgi:hypothetical protein